MTKKNISVAVGMSGGVDSSVAAYLLKEQGYNVFGLYMKNWDDEECPHVEEYRDVMKVCQKLDIPCYQVNFVKEYWDGVFASFLEDLEVGLTPNPDVLCNSKVKFKAFYDKALAIGADRLATGHYASIHNNCLVKAKDENKDQTYFLNQINGTTLRNVLFPLGNIEKHHVRDIAKQAGLHTASKKDSTGICFIGKRKFPEFISNYISSKEGFFLDENGKRIGKHSGAHLYTRGQRKGLGIGGQGDAWYVASKDIVNNTVNVVQGENHPALFSQSILIDSLHIINKDVDFPDRVEIRIRHRGALEKATLKLGKKQETTITFDTPVWGVSKGQYAAVYTGNICIGGGKIVELYE